MLTKQGSKTAHSRHHKSFPSGQCERIQWPPSLQIQNISMPIVGLLMSTFNKKWVNTLGDGESRRFQGFAILLGATMFCRWSSSR